MPFRSGNASRVIGNEPACAHSLTIRTMAAPRPTSSRGHLPAKFLQGETD
jgi:hypothetical protein